MAPNTNKAYTVGSSNFDPEIVINDQSLIDEIHNSLKANDLKTAIHKAFSIPETDSYVYHANVSINLSQVQKAVSAGPAHGLHDWYLDEFGKTTNYPEISDIASYISLFDPSKSAANALKGMKSNAKKGSLRAGVAEYLTSKRYLDPSVVVSKRKAPHQNPYIDFWAWSCQSLEYAGPDQYTVNLKMSHHVLPIFMHHFGCACPSYESLEIMKKLATGKTILDIGSGNGYWTLMLRRQGCNVVAVDSGQSTWRTCWIDDTVNTDGIQFIKKRGDNGAKDDVLLMVYPIVSGDFTRKVIDTYKGDVIAVAGTQNGNGYTGFKDEMVDRWMGREKQDFEKIVQIPLPSFAGKDDALFVFRRKV